MENETKQCPYCGEEILAVAKKCKHCGEWLDAEAMPQEPCPICGEDNPVGTTKCKHCGEVINATSESISSTDKSQTLLSNAVPSYDTSSLLILLYTIIIWIGGYAGNTYNAINGLVSKDMLILSPYLAIFWAVVIVGTGIYYSQKFTSPVKTIATLRAWIALGIVYAWYPVMMTLGWILVKIGLFNSVTSADYEGFMAIIYLGMFVAAIVVWLVYKFGKKPTLDEIFKHFTIFTTLVTILLAMAMVMQFGVTSLLPGVHL